MPARIALNTHEEAQLLRILPFIPERDRCLLIVGLNTGFRASELTAIKIADVWDGASVRAELTLARRHLKGGRGVHRSGVRSRTLPLNRAAREAIEAFLSSRTNLAGQAPLFRSRRTGRGLTRWQVNRIIHRAAALAGIERLARIGTHTLRKTFASKVYQATGYDVNATRALLGHRHISTTENYLSTDTARLNAAVLAIAS